MKDLGGRSITAVFWGGGGAILRIVLQLITQIALARILGPAQYGLFAIGAIVISFSNFFSDIGIAYGLIQKTEVTDYDLRFVFTWQIIIGSIVTFIVAYYSNSIALFLGDVNAGGVVLFLAIVCLLNALAAPSNNMLKRSLNFKSIQIAQLSGYVGGYIFVGLPLALAGMKVWALVAAWVVQASITLAMLYASAQHPLRLLFWHADSQSISKYGGVVLITNITNWLIGNIDRVIIARFFSSKEVGLYATSYNVLQNPTSALLGVIQPVFFSASSRLSDDRSKVSNAYYALIGAIALFIFPVFSSVAAVSETFMSAVYGVQWLSAASVFRPLALAMPLFLIWGMTTPLLWTGGTPIREFKAQFPIAILWVAVSWVAAHYSTAMVGWSVCAMFALRCFVVIYIARKTLNLSWRHLWEVTRGGLFIAMICVMTIVTLDLLLIYFNIAYAFIRIIVEGFLMVILYVTMLLKMPYLIPDELAMVISRVAESCSPNIARHLGKIIKMSPSYVDR